MYANMWHQTKNNMFHITHGKASEKPRKNEIKRSRKNWLKGNCVCRLCVSSSCQTTSNVSMSLLLWIFLRFREKMTNKMICTLIVATCFFLFAWIFGCYLLCYKYLFIFWFCYLCFTHFPSILRYLLWTNQISCHRIDCIIIFFRTYLFWFRYLLQFIDSVKCEYVGWWICCKSNDIFVLTAYFISIRRTERKRIYFYKFLYMIFSPFRSHFFAFFPLRCKTRTW